MQRVDAVRAGKRGESHSTMLAGRRYRLCLTGEQERKATRIAGCCRAVWNAALEQRRLAWELRRQCVCGAQQMAELPALKREPGFQWLAQDGIAQSLQQTIRDLDVAYRRWLLGVAGRPRFKRRDTDASFRLPQGRDLRVRRLSRRWAEVRVSKLGWCRFRLTRPLGGEIRHATVNRDALGWHVSFCVALNQQPAEPNCGPAVGIDRGVVATVALSTGELRHCPELPSGQSERLRRLCRRAGRQETARRKRPDHQRRRSRRHQRTLDQVAHLKARDARIRRNWLHKLSTGLATSHGLVAIENLSVRDMTRTAKGSLIDPGMNVRAKSGLNRRILAQGWGELRRQLQYKAAWYGSALAEVSAHYTSQTCSVCGIADPRSRESQARFRCQSCGHTAHADVNAARVILVRAIDGHEDGGRIGPPQRVEPSRQWPGPRSANHPDSQGSMTSPAARNPRASARGGDQRSSR